METTDYAPEIRALATHLGIDPDDAIEGPYSIEAEGGEWLALSDADATEKAEDYIRDSLWTFRPEFLIGYMPNGLTVAVLEKMAGALCEDANEAFLALAGDALPMLLADAISNDGRGRFLSSYDGAEHEVEVDGDTYYIYRVN